MKRGFVAEKSKLFVNIHYISIDNNIAKLYNVRYTTFFQP